MFFQKIHPWARFELPSRRHCSEKLGAVAALYRPGIEGAMNMSTSKHAAQIICENIKGGSISEIKKSYSDRKNAR